MLSNKKISRRELLVGAGFFGLGLFCNHLGKELGLGKFDLKVAIAEAKEMAKKWPYVKLDPEKVGEIAYQNWFSMFCAQATASGAVEQLVEKVGEPWKSFPVKSLKFGMGGMLGWGVTCGSPVAASLIVGLVVPDDATVNAMIHDILNWYINTELPTYTPKNPKYKKEIIKTVPGSPLCHVSVGRWMRKANAAFASLPRRDRCARLSASVIYKTIEMLNMWMDGKYKPGEAWNAPSAVGIPAQPNCMDCHGGNVPTPPKET